MNFFIDGGFQQLFNELNQELLDSEMVYNGHDNQSAILCEDLQQVHTNSCDYADFELYQDTLNPITEHSIQESSECKYSLLSLNSVAFHKTDTKDDNNNNIQEHSDNSLINSDQTCYESLLRFLPTDESSNNCDSSEYTDFAEWEHKFLDNFIEIPELVDFLPERTPFCNDNCFDFFEESSQNLRLLTMTATTIGGKHEHSASSIDCELDSTSTEDELIVRYPCTFGTCQKVYAKPAHLKAHMRRHLGEKPYICNWPECTWKFSRSDELARHRRSHSGIKPYKCEYCAKCFARSDHLTKHRKVHERRLLAASMAGKAINGVLPSSVYAVRPGRRRKNQI